MVPVTLIFRFTYLQGEGTSIFYIVISEEEEKNSYLPPCNDEVSDSFDSLAVFTQQP